MASRLMLNLREVNQSGRDTTVDWQGGTLQFERACIATRISRDTTSSLGALGRLDTEEGGASLVCSASLEDILSTYTLDHSSEKDEVISVCGLDRPCPPDTSC